MYPRPDGWEDLAADHFNPFRWRLLALSESARRDANLMNPCIPQGSAAPPSLPSFPLAYTYVCIYVYVYIYIVYIGVYSSVYNYMRALQGAAAQHGLERRQWEYRDVCQGHV